MIVTVAEYDGWNEYEILQNLGVLKEIRKFYLI